MIMNTKTETEKLRAITETIENSEEITITIMTIQISTIIWTLKIKKNTVTIIIMIMTVMVKLFTIEVGEIETEKIRQKIMTILNMTIVTVMTMTMITNITENEQKVTKLIQIIKQNENQPPNREEILHNRQILLKT